MKSLLLLVFVLAVMPPPLPNVPLRFTKASEPTTNTVLKLEWKLPGAPQVAIYRSTNLINWIKVLTVSSEVYSNISVGIEPDNEPQAYYKWEIIK